MSKIEHCADCPIAKAQETVANAQGPNRLTQLLTSMDRQRTDNFIHAACVVKNGGICPMTGTATQKIAS